jgi:hypothetical protein
MVFKKGQIGYWKGKKRSKETKRKISLTKKGNSPSPNRGKTLEDTYGKLKAEEIRKCMSHSRKGKSPWNKGMKGEEYKSHFKKGMKGQFQKGNQAAVSRKKQKFSAGWFRKGFKHTEEWKKKMSERMRGDNHPNWRGGKTPWGPEFTQRFKKEIRQRDNYVCQECGYSQEELGYKLHVHHIDYDKQNNHPSNLISLCRSCHMQTNFSRKDWQEYFKIKIGDVST